MKPETNELRKKTGGRPSLKQAEQIEEHILDNASHLFLNHGYGATSIESIARHAGISKRTFYHRFEDKEALFGAVVHRLLNRLRPASGIPHFMGKTIEEILTELARIILHASLDKEALALQRIMIAEAARFPELAVALDKHARKDAIDFIGAILEREVVKEHLQVRNVTFAAEQFLQMIISVPQRRALGLGIPLNELDKEQWVKDTVGLFLQGCHQK